MPTDQTRHAPAWSRRKLLTGASVLAAANLMPGFVRPSFAGRPLIRHETAAEGEPVSRGGSKLTIRRLSLDPTTGGATLYYEAVAAWHGQDTAHYHTGSEEVFVLDGSVTLDGEDYLRKGDYLYRPGGIVHGHHEGALEGCRMIIRTGAAMDFNYVKEPASPKEYVLVPNSDGRPHIVHLKTAEMQPTWVGEGAHRYSRKILSADAKTGAHTSLIDFPAAWKGKLPLESAVGWEWFVVAGQAKLDDGTVYAADSYSFRPAGANHAFVSAAANTQILMWRQP